MEKSFQDRMVQMVVFELNKKEYGIPVHATKEVIRLTDIVAIPNAPDFISGVINLRGNILCVIDLRKQFNFPVQNSDETRIIIAKLSRMMVGLIVDRVHEVMKIMKTQIDPVPEILNIQMHQNCLVGMAKMNERIITLLNLEKILSEEQIKQLDQNRM
jgi:purine-binding chemotaxis protein CheW